MTSIELFKHRFKQVTTFFYEMPLPVSLSAVSCVALAILFPPLVPPLMIYVLLTVLTRLAVKVFTWISPQKVNYSLFEIHAWLTKLRYFIYVIALIATLWIPLVGIGVATGIGIYEGYRCEFESIKLAQAQNRNHHRLTNWNTWV